MSYPSHQISPTDESPARGRRCGMIALLMLSAGVLFAVSTIAPRPAEGFVFQQPPMQIDDGLTEEERELINRPISELTPEERKDRDRILKKMETHLLQMMDNKTQQKKEEGGDKKAGAKPPTTVRPKRPTRRPNQKPEAQEPKDKEEEVKKEDASKRPALARPRKTYTPPGAEPPAESEDNYRLPFDQRRYSFGMRNGNYDELVRMFARKTGLPVLGLPVKLVGAKPEDSKITYVSAELTDFRTTLHQINDLLFYEVLPPLYLYYNAEEFRLELDAFKELRFKLPPSRLFTSIESVEIEVAQGKLMPSDIVRVFFSPKTAANMRVFNEQVSNMFGEWVLMSIVEGTGVIDYTGRVDILERIQKYMDKIRGAFKGEAELIIIPVEYIEPSEALEKLMLLVPNVITGASEGNFRGRRAPRGRNAKDDPSTSEAQKILVIPDDDYDVLLVRGLPYKVDEVRKILEFIDRPPADPDFPDPVVIKLKHAQAEAAAAILEEIVNGRRKPRIRTGRPKKGEATRIVGASGGDELRIIPVTRDNSLILLGSKERIDHARRIIAEVLDKEYETPFLQVRVEQADPEQIAAKVLSLLSPPGKKGDRGPENLNIEVIGSVLFVRGEPALMNTAASLIKELDGQMPKPTVFVTHLENAKPSEVVNYLRLIMPPSGAPPAKNKRGVRQPGNAGRFVDDDATGRVFYRGSQREWEQEILPLIKLFDEARDIEGGGNIEFVEIKFADPNNIVSTLNSVYGTQKRGGKKGENDGPQFIPTPRGVIITGTVSGSELKHIRQMIDLMDPDLDKFEKRTFMLTNIDPEEVEEAIISLFIATKSGGGRRPSKGGAPAPAQTIRMALISGGIIVHAPKEDMPELALFIEQLDAGVNSPKFIRRNFDLEHADPQVVQEAIHNLFSGGGVPKGKRRPDAGPLDKNTIRTSISARSIIVFAAEERFAEIENVIQILDRPAAEDAIVTRRFEMIYADAEEMADQLEQMLLVKLSEMQSRASGKNKAGVRKPALSVLANTKSNSIWLTAPLSIVEHAAKLVPELDREESEIETIYKIYDCVNSQADDLADLLNMLYGGGGAQTTRRSGDKKKDATARTRERIRRRLEGGGADDLNIVALPGNQAVSISGPRKKVEQALVRAIELDHKSQRIGAYTKTFTLLWADVDGVADGIIEMLGDKARGTARKASDDFDLWDFETGPRRSGEISVWPRYETSSLIVHAPADKMVLIEAFIGECELLADPDNPELPALAEPFVFYRPKYLGAYEIVSMTRTVILTVYKNPLPVDLDYLDRSTVVLKGTRRYFDEVLDLITKYVDTEENAGAVEPVTSFLPPVPGNMHAAQVIGMVSKILTDLDVEMQDVSGTTSALLGDMIPEIPAGPSTGSDRDSRGTE